MEWLTGNRKLEHLKLAVRENVEHGDPWFRDVILVHNSVPGLDLGEIDTSVEFLGKRLKAPVMIVGMTGGVEEAEKINKDLAEVAENLGIAFGVGSQRAMLERPEMWETYYVRDVAPSTLVFGNIGLAQIGQYPEDKIIGMIKKTGADALAVHLNPAQEAVQPEGDWDFSGKLRVLESIAKKVPVVAKEVGNGVSREVASRLRRIGVKAVDVGGWGGTNWVKIDAMRAGETTPFVDWGIPTAASVIETSRILPTIATGGIRNGLDAAKAIALGASIVGIGLPVLRWYVAGGKERAESELIRFIHELRIAMFLTGSKNVYELKQADVVVTGRLREWCEARGVDVRHFANRKAAENVF